MDVIIPIIDMICLITLIVGMRIWQRRYGRLSEKTTALICCGYGSFFTITTFTSIYFETHLNLVILVEILCLLIVWSLGYLGARWLYRQINSPK
jgi:hypothetical protein